VASSAGLAALEGSFVDIDPLVSGWLGVLRLVVFHEALDPLDDLGGVLLEGSLSLRIGSPDIERLVVKGERDSPRTNLGI